MSTALSLTAAAQGDSPESIKATHRYTDAYRQARSIVLFGRVIKILGCIAGVMILVAAMISGAALQREYRLGLEQSQYPIVAGAIFAVFVTGSFWIAGSLVCARGQHLMAALDSAVHSSTFMSNEQRARAMSLF